MAALRGTVLVSKIVPSDSLDQYATHDEDYGRGGYRTVSDIASRDAIPEPRRKVGMKVFVTSESIEYQLIGGIANSNWLESGSIGKEFSKIAGVDINVTDVCVIVDSLAILADASIDSHRTLPKYFAKETVVAGVSLKLIEQGTITKTGWGLSANLPLFLLDNGQISNVPPALGFVQQVGVALNDDTLDIGISVPIKL